MEPKVKATPMTRKVLNVKATPMTRKVLNVKISDH